MLIINAVKASVARFLLAVHATVAVWRTTLSECSNRYWFLLLVLFCVVLDLTVVLLKRRGKEWKWFSPSILFYLGTTLPCIWLMEIRRLKLKKHNLFLLNNNESQSDILSEVDQQFSEWLAGFGAKFDFNTWVNLIEQAMLPVMIIARWMLPVSKEDISRDQLSQLLLVYLGLAADILELLAIFDEPQVLDQQLFVEIILGFWCWSLMQFTLVLTATRARAFSTNNRENEETESDDSSDVTPPGLCTFCDGEVWGIVIMGFMLDLPFLAIRVTAITHYQIQTYSIYFFTVKNLLMVLALGYRLVIVCAAQWREFKDAQSSDLDKNYGIPGMELDIYSSVELDTK